MEKNYSKCEHLANSDKNKIMKTLAIAFLRQVDIVFGSNNIICIFLDSKYHCRMLVKTKQKQTYFNFKKKKKKGRECCVLYCMALVIIWETVMLVGYSLWGIVICMTNIEPV